MCCQSHPAVRRRRLLRRPDEKYGEEVGAAVTLRADAEPGELIEHCRERLAAFKVPAQIYMLERDPAHAPRASSSGAGSPSSSRSAGPAMRFAVLGAGAIGAYVGAALARGGADVTLIARGAHLRAMARARRAGPVAARRLRRAPARRPTTSPRSPTPTSCSSRSRRTACPRSRRGSAGCWPRAPRRSGRRTASRGGTSSRSRGPLDGLTGLESVDPGGVIAASIPPEHVVGCVVYCSTEIVEPGVIRHVEGTRFTIGEPDGAGPTAVRAISGRFAAGGLRAPVDAQAARPDLAQAARQRRPSTRSRR